MERASCWLGVSDSCENSVCIYLGLCVCEREKDSNPGHFSTWTVHIICERSKTHCLHVDLQQMDSNIFYSLNITKTMACTRQHGLPLVRRIPPPKISFLSMPPSCLTPNAWVGLMSFLCEVPLGAWLDSWEWIWRMDVAVIASGCIMKK